MVAWIAENTFHAGMIALVAWVAGRTLRRWPGVCHILWLLVVVRLLVPPIDVGMSPPRTLRSAVEQATSPIAPLIRPGPLEAPSGAFAATLDAGARSQPVASRGDLEAAPTAELTALGEGASKPGRSSTMEATKAAPDTAAAMATWSRRVRQVFAALWILGAVMAAGLQGRSLLQHVRLLRTSRPADRELEDAVALTARALGIRAPKTRCHPGLSGPMVSGLGRPVLIWPGVSGTPISRALIAHELAHLERRDHWTAWIEMVGAVVLWWHPLFHAARRQLRLHREVACDARALGLTSVSPRSYASQLIDVAEGAKPSVTALPGLGAGGMATRDFERRLRAVLRTRLRPGTPWRLTLPMLIAVAPLAIPWSSASRLDTLFAPSESAPQDALSLSRRAQVFMSAGEWARAREALVLLAKLDPERGDVRRDLATTLIRLGEHETAVPQIEAQMQLGHDLPGAWYSLAACRALEGRTDEAMRALQSAAEHGFDKLYRVLEDPDLERLRAHTEFPDRQRSISRNARLSDRAREALEAGQLRVAIGALEELAKAAPRSGRTQEMIADAYVRMGNVRAALPHARKQLDLGYAKELGNFHLACALSASGASDEALEALAAAFAAGFSDLDRVWRSFDKKAAAGCARFGEVLDGLVRFDAERGAIATALQEGRLDDAEQRSLALLARPLPIAWVRGWLWRSLVRARSAPDRVGARRDALSQQIALQFEPAEAHYECARLEAQAGRDEAALAALEMAISRGFLDVSRLERDASFASLWKSGRLASLVQLAGDRPVLEWFGAVDWEHLRERSAQRIEKNPSDGQAYHHLGWSYLRLQRADLALEAFRSQDRTGFACSTARYNIACASALLGQREQALDWLEKALEVGWFDGEHMANDPDLSTLRKEPRFSALLERLRAAAREHPGYPPMEEG